MPLAAGTRVGPYEIVALLGAGGMGEVYRASDSRLRRDVALKVLPQAFAADPQRMARFEREAQVLASLNHPNIGAIYGLEESGTTRALVMELVEGPTLAARIGRNPVPLAEAMPIARQIAEALEFAHERGIIHRDLKPANVKFTQTDSLKVLDFGLAKALADDPSSSNISSSPTLSGTRAGSILGTPAYMSPEQARGKPVDRRTDIWSFGCVLFELLTGRMAFQGETVTDTLAAVLTTHPPLEGLPSSTPPNLRRLIERCLQKDVRERLQAIGDARIEIEDSLSGRGMHEWPLLGVGKAQPNRRGGTRWLIPAAAILAGAVLVTVLVAATKWWAEARQARAQTWTGDLVSGPNIALGARVSPDGHTVAFQSMIDSLTQVAVANPDTGNWTVLTHDRQHGFVNEISWAPDGSKLYFDRTIAVPAGIYSVPALGGDERLVLADAGCPQALPDGSLLVIHRDGQGLWRIHHYWPDSQRLEPLPGWISISTTIPLRVFPDGREAVFHGTQTQTETSDHLYVMDLTTGKTRRLAPDLTNPRNSESFPLAATADGRAVLAVVSAGDLQRLVSVPRDGRGAMQTLLTLTRPPWYIDSTKDGSVYLDQVDRPHEILRFPSSGGTPEVLASSVTEDSGAQYMDPVQTADGRFLLDTAFSGTGRLLIGKPDGDFVPLLDTREETSGPAVSLANGQIAFVLGTGPEQTIAIASTTEGRLVRRLAGSKGRGISGLAASPDGKTLYFAAGEFVWAIATDDGAPRKLAAGGAVTVSSDGRTLILTQNVRSNPRFMSVPSEGGGEKEIHLESGQSLAPVPIGSRALSRDGRLLINLSPPNSWFYRVAVLNLATGHITPTPVTYQGDTMSGNWTADGQVLAVGLPLKSHIWRFRRSVQ